MAITLEQARTLEALARHGTFAAAAAALQKRHTAVVYTMKTLEQATGLELLDREGYRTRLTPAGTRVLEECRRLLAAEAALERLCESIRGGWEPTLRLVFDGVVPSEPVVREVVRVAQVAPTRLHVSEEFLSGVEAAFERDAADIMISVMPPERAIVESRALPEIRAALVAHAEHPLARAGTASAEDLERHVLLSVRGSDPRLQLPTVALEPRSVVSLNDFNAKKAAIVAGVGYGWLPERMIARELRRGAVRRIRWAGASVHAFAPRLYTRAGTRLGRAGAMLVNALFGTAW